MQSVYVYAMPCDLYVLNGVCTVCTPYGTYPTLILLGKFLLIATLVKRAGEKKKKKDKLTLASLLLARIWGPKNTNTHGTRVKAAPCMHNTH